ncbi:MAG: sulfatase [Deltaproteobacteria bacterium]|nr:sulfatase [Deltaproteobacteria bacterium]
MRIRPSHVAALLALAACGKSSREQSAAEPKAGPGSPPPPPAQTQAEPPKKPSRGPERAVYSLVDNRLAAHVTRGGGLFLPAGSAAFAKYTQHGNVARSLRPWLLEQKQGDVRVARTSSRYATLHVPLTAAQAQNATVRIRAYAGTAGTLSVRGKKKEATTKLAEGWSVAEVKLADGELADGENTLTVHLNARDVAVEWIQIGGEAAPEAAPIHDAKADALALPKGVQMAWYALVPEKGRLAGDVGGDAACAVSATATADDGTTVKGALAGTGEVVDLAKLGGRPARIELEATGCAAATLAKAALVVPGEAPPAPTRGEPPQHVVFIIMDSLRYDRVHGFNPKARTETPNFDKLAESSAMFHQHYVQGNESQVSHASMWSANYLAKHRAIEWQDTLADKWVTLDEVARAGKMFAAAATGNGYIRPFRGYGNSWNEFVNHIERGGGLKGVDIMERGLSFVAGRKTQPWFLYLGMIDTHVQWYAKKPWIDRYDGGYKGRFMVEFGDEPNGFPTDLTEAEKDHVRALYDSNVSYQDDLLGKLRERLEQWGIWDKTMLIVTADHGDEQWEEGGRVGHGGSLNETLIHVPLLVHYPPLVPAKQVRSGTEGIDVLPTIADAIGVAPDAEWQGTSLLALAHAPDGYPQMSTASWRENFHAARIGDWKVRVAGGNPPRVFDVGKDPLEKTDLHTRPGAAIAERMLLDPTWTHLAYQHAWKKSQWGNPANVSKQFATDHGE